MKSVAFVTAASATSGKLSAGASPAITALPSRNEHAARALVMTYARSIAAPGYAWRAADRLGCGSTPPNAVKCRQVLANRQDRDPAEFDLTPGARLLILMSEARCRPLSAEQDGAGRPRR